MTHSARLRSKIELVSGPWDEVAGRFWSHPRLAELYPEYLFLIHGIMRTAVPLMKAARQRALRIPSSDLVASGLAIYLEGHIREEGGEDVWALEDLEVLGVPRAEVLSRIPSPTVAALTGSQYYWIAHDHPVALLGYMLVLEGYPPSAERLEAAIEETGLPRGAFRTLLRHAVVDEQHREDLEETIDSLPIDGRQTALLGISACRTVHLLTACLRELVAGYERRLEVVA